MRSFLGGIVSVINLLILVGHSLFFCPHLLILIDVARIIFGQGVVDGLGLGALEGDNFDNCARC